MNTAVRVDRPVGSFISDRAFAMPIKPEGGVGVGKTSSDTKNNIKSSLWLKSYKQLQ